MNRHPHATAIIFATIVLIVVAGWYVSTARPARSVDCLVLSGGYPVHISVPSQADLRCPGRRDSVTHYTLVVPGQPDRHFPDSADGFRSVVAYATRAASRFRSDGDFEAARAVEIIDSGTERQEAEEQSSFPGRDEPESYNRLPCGCPVDSGCTGWHSDS